MHKAYKGMIKGDSHQDRQIQKKYEELGKKDRRNSASELQYRSQPKTQPQAPKSAPKKSAATGHLDKLKPVQKKPVSRSKPTGSELSGKASWSPEDQALANRLKRLRGQITHDTIVSSGKPKNFEQLKQQLHSISSVDDLKAIVADRRASKITPDQQRRYLGLLNAAVQGMAKNPQYAEKMNADLIRDVLKEQPGEAKTAIKLLHNTNTDSLQRRLDRLRSQK